MILTEFDEEVFKQNVREDGYLEGLEEGMAKGVEKGTSQKAIEDAENFLKLGVGTVEQISQAIGLPLEQVLQIKENLSIKA